MKPVQEKPSESSHCRHTPGSWKAEVPCQRGLSPGLLEWSLAYPSERDPRERQAKNLHSGNHRAFFNLISERTYYRIQHIQSVIQTTSDKMWEVATQGVNTRGRVRGEHLGSWRPHAVNMECPQDQRACAVHHYILNFRQQFWGWGRSNSSHPPSLPFLNTNTFYYPRSLMLIGSQAKSQLILKFKRKWGNRNRKDEMHSQHHVSLQRHNPNLLTLVLTCLTAASWNELFSCYLCLILTVCTLVIVILSQDKFLE